MWGCARSEPIRSPPVLTPGQTVDRYEVEAPLGAGGMASVWKVRHTLLGSRHALKVLAPELTTSPEVRDRFLAEARILAQLQHPHLARVTDLVVGPGIAGLVQELLEGEDLALLLDREGAQSVSRAATILRPVLQALQYVHEHGVVHRDLKPANVFLHQRPGGGWRPVLLDFGVARLTEAASVDHGRWRRTRTGATVGTPHYMSPEQVREVSTVDRRSDLWAMGCVLYEVLTGRSAFDGASDFAIMERVVAGAWGDEAGRARIPAPLHPVLSKAFAVDRDRRFASAGAFLAALEVATTAMTSPATGRPAAKAERGPVDGWQLVRRIVASYRAPRPPAIDRLAVLHDRKDAAALAKEVGGLWQGLVRHHMDSDGTAAPRRVTNDFLAIQAALGRLPTPARAPSRPDAPRSVSSALDELLRAYDPQVPPSVNAVWRYVAADELRSLAEELEALWTELTRWHVKREVPLTEAHRRAWSSLERALGP